jgi:hypothetical protein
MIMEKIKAGYVSFGTMFYEPGNLKMISKRAEQQLIDAGLDLIITSPVYGEGPEPERAIRELKAKDWDFLFVNIINWIDTRGVFRVLHEFREKPMILYSFGGFTDHEGKFGEKGTLISPAAGAGSTSVRFPMEQWGIKFKYLFTAPDSPMDIDGIMSFAIAAKVLKKLRYARLGMIGGYSGPAAGHRLVGRDRHQRGRHQPRQRRQHHGFAGCDRRMGAVRVSMSRSGEVR